MTGPIKKWKTGAWEIAIWSNKRKFNGEELEFKTASLSRSYKKKGEEIWRSDIVNFRKSDIVKMNMLLDKARDFLFLAEVEE